MNVRILALLLALLFLAFVVELTRRERLTFKYAFGWMTVSVFGVLLALFDHLLRDASQRLGFELPSNFVFFTILAGLIFLSLLLTIFSSQQNIRNDRMAQKIALLEKRITDLEKKDPLN